MFVGGLPNPGSGASSTPPAVIIVSFDVPERERRKRDWLRDALRNLGLRMVHKSVWIGKQKLPREFLADLARLRLTDFIEVFEVGKQGSLRHIV